ncbi:hypothetical protein LOK74_06025 [Brevibacillus humidisoli]|uniref:hypothetical protein n=1 Tax=Brevibacillus humidisoli TaxID=2895522 RepID=UPI001E4C376A|nr:hypothetical protein [Brevibacillus humidisoli]UFJ42053.1 hypothetical protein LOK74_06025 [Brevibacillus humidisoli]
MLQQMTSQSQQQQVMMTPPAVVTTKDLLYLRDAMSWMLVAMKKCAHFAQECTDSQVRQAIDQVGQMHQRHYNMLLSHCKNNNVQGMASISQPMSQ